MLKKSLLLLSLCLLLVLPVGTCSAEEMYQATPGEVLELNQIFSELLTTSTTQGTMWTQLNSQLKKSNDLANNLQTQVQNLNEQSQNLKKQVTDYQNATQNLNSSLDKASKEIAESKNSLNEVNKSFETYKKEEQLKQNKLKAERDIGWAIAAYFIIKK